MSLKVLCYNSGIETILSLYCQVNESVFLESMGAETEIQKKMMVVAASMGCQFTLRGEPIKAETVFSPVGLLPAIMRRADQLASFCLGNGLGLTFERAESAMLGVMVVMDDKIPTALRLLCATDVLAEFIQQAPAITAVAVDDLAAD